MSEPELTITGQLCCAKCEPPASLLIQQDQPAMSTAPTICQTLPPEDVGVDDYVTQMQIVHELPSFYWSDDVTLQDPGLPVRYACIPGGSGLPARVRSVCLPFVFVETATGDFLTWDVRLCRIARMSPQYAEQVWKRFKVQRTKKKRRKRQKKKKSS